MMVGVSSALGFPSEPRWYRGEEIPFVLEDDGIFHFKGRMVGRLV